MIELARQRLRVQLAKTHPSLQRRPVRDAGEIGRRIGRWRSWFPRPLIFRGDYGGEQRLHVLFHQGVPERIVGPAGSDGD